MKRYSIYLVTLLLLFFSSCEKEPVDLTFDAQPEERISERMNELRSLLLEAEHGWKGNLVTGLGSYGFYLNFEDETNCVMLSDLTSETSTEPSASTYRIIWAMNAALSFDTFNYITMLQEPSSNFGGQAPNGYISDVDFDYEKNSGDTLYLKGKKYQLPFTLTKVTAEDKERYLSSGYPEAIETTQSFFHDNPNAYVNIDSAGTTYKVGISIDKELRVFGASYVDQENKTKSAFSFFTFTLDGIDVLTPPGTAVLGTVFLRAEWDGNQFNLIDTEGQQYEIRNNERPIIPLNKAIGTQYASFYSPYLTYFPGTSPAGREILARFHDGLESGATGFRFNSGNIRINWDATNQRMSVLGFSSQNGGASGWTTTIVYDYEFDENTEIFRFTKRSGPTGGYTGAILDQLDDFLLNSGVQLDYHTVDATTYGLMKGVERPEVEITFQLLN